MDFLFNFQSLSNSLALYLPLIARLYFLSRLVSRLQKIISTHKRVRDGFLDVEEQSASLQVDFVLGICHHRRDLARILNLSQIQKPGIVHYGFSNHFCSLCFSLSSYNRRLFVLHRLLHNKSGSLCFLLGWRRQAIKIKSAFTVAYRFAWLRLRA